MDIGKSRLVITCWPWQELKDSQGVPIFNALVHPLSLMFKFVNNSFKPSIRTSVSCGNVHRTLYIIISAVCRCQDQEAPAPWGAARLRGPAPVTLTLRGISSHENWDWGLGPGSQSPDIPGQGSGQSSPRLCDVRRSVKCKEFTRRKCEKRIK